MFKKLKENKKAQIEVTFNWVYIMIAGTVILLFFIGLVVRQQGVSEEKLTTDVVDIMGSIFAGAGVSEKTKNFISTSGIADYTLYFSCEDKLGVYGIKDHPARIEDTVNPIFAPLELKTSKLILWSLPYRLPFKVIDFLFVSAENVNYYLLGQDYVFLQEFLNSTQGFNRNVISASEYQELSLSANTLVRFVDLDGQAIKNGNPLPLGLMELKDSAVTAVSFLSGGREVIYFQKNNDRWQQLNQKPIPIISIDRERDAAKYAAIFSGDAQTYQCNMQKAFQRLEYLNEVYLSKLSEMQSYYASNQGLKLSTDCPFYLTENSPNLVNALNIHQGNTFNCLIDVNSCLNLENSALDLRDSNNNLAKEGNCLTLY